MSLRWRQLASTAGVSLERPRRDGTAELRRNDRRLGCGPESDQAGGRLNQRIAARLREAAELLEQQQANPFL